MSWLRLIAQVCLDAAGWTAGLTFATLARLDFDLQSVNLPGLALISVVAAVLQLGSGTVFGLYSGRWQFGSFDEVAAVVRAAALTTAALFVIDRLLADRPIPLGATLGGGVTALVLLMGTRYLWRLVRERRGRPSGEGASRLLVFGAGQAATQVIRAMLRDPESPYVPAAILDDDRGKRNLRILGVPVVGSREAVPEAAHRYDAHTVLIAIPSADHALISEITDIASSARLKVKVLPPVRDLLGGNVDVRDIRPLTEADLLGRHEVKVDLDQIAGYLRGRRVLVTGAGGSIGSELCRQLRRFAPEELVMADRDESALQAVELSMDGRGLLDTKDLVVLDIRDRERLDEVFAERRPEVVFHAAALKHVPLLEAHPSEALKTNVWGTLNVLEAAAAHGVERFINISTDKAADPANVLGYSKRIAERLTAHFAHTAGGKYVSVRFGNVLGSNGSVLETFRKQIEAGGPVTVTHELMTRYFMTVEEAILLVIQAGAIGEDGEVLVLDMGEPVSIKSLAERLVAQADQPVRVVYTGLRAGDKLRETPFGHDEVDHRPMHPLISHVPVSYLDPTFVRNLDPKEPVRRLVRQFEARCHQESEPYHDQASRVV